MKYIYTYNIKYGKREEAEKSLKIREHFQINNDDDLLRI